MIQGSIHPSFVGWFNTLQLSIDFNVNPATIAKCPNDAVFQSKPNPGPVTKSLIYICVFSVYFYIIFLRGNLKYSALLFSQDDSKVTIWYNKLGKSW